MTTPVHVKGQPIEPCPHTHVRTCFGHTVSLNTVKRALIISAFVILIFAGSQCALTGNPVLSSLGWKLGTSCVNVVASITLFYSYLLLAGSYNIAPPGLYKALPVS